MGSVGQDGSAWGRLATGVAVLLALSIPWSAMTRADSAAGSEVRVDSGWVRALPPGQPVTAAFMVLVNTGDRERRLEAVTSPLAGRVELHRTVQQGDRVRMEAIDVLPIAPGGQVALEPGGLHLMLMELQRPLKVGEQVPLSLTLDGGEPVSISLPVVDMRHRDGAHRHSGHAH